ncbi:MAG: HflC protein [Halobacteriovoraceae bacterium]|nr:HflC protein [Halobacteriovoraceae bacterium]|tara:strand:- start:2111 stop:3085 length:975 start_codon:yes stop_codon:yes gene_type:complete
MKNSPLGILLPLFGIAILLSLWSGMYIVTEGRQAIITQLGKPVGEPINEAGLYFKIPFIQETKFVDKRILTWDGLPNQVTAKDKKFINVDTTARWRIVDTLKFIQTVQNEAGAKSKLDSILDGATRDVISSQNLVEAVRNSNSIIEKIEEKKAEIERKKKAGEPIVEEEVSGEIAKIDVGREQLSQMILKKAKDDLANLGIELIDVQLRRISYEQSVEKKVYERMISERQRIAEKIRSIGKGEKAKIEGRINKELKQIESQAYKQAEIIKGKADAKAAAIYSKSLNKNRKFYDFTRSMEAYKKSLSEDTKLILSSEAEFFKYLR